jgi:aldose 1-epimerase
MKRVVWMSAAATAIAIGMMDVPAARQAPAAKQAPAPITQASYGATADGTQVEIFTLRNAGGMEVSAITYGAIISSIRVPDRQGKLADVVLGHDSLKGYLERSRFFGAVVGRYGNRIARGRFTLDGREYTLATNNGPNHLHGGPKGFDKVVWKGAIAKPSAAGHGVVFSRTSPDGEEGYPGNLAATVTYRLSDSNELTIEYHATTDKPTPVNLTQHTYFNLGGHASGTRVVDHNIRINADRYTPVDQTLIPTGELASVTGTPFDLRRPAFIGTGADAAHEQIKIAGGYDHNFVLSARGTGLAHAAWLHDSQSGRSLDVFTTEPGLQFYSGNNLETTAGKDGATYGRRAGLCLETQHFPDSPNRPNFPSTIVRPGTPYTSKTVWRFGVVK